MIADRSTQPRPSEITLTKDLQESSLRRDAQLMKLLAGHAADPAPALLWHARPCPVEPGDLSVSGMRCASRRGDAARTAATSATARIRP